MKAPSIQHRNAIPPPTRNSSGITGAYATITNGGVRIKPNDNEESYRSSNATRTTTRTAAKCETHSSKSVSARGRRPRPAWRGLFSLIHRIITMFSLDCIIIVLHRHWDVWRTASEIALDRARSPTWATREFRISPRAHWHAFTGDAKKINGTRIIPDTTCASGCIL